MPPSSVLTIAIPRHSGRSRRADRLLFEMLARPYDASVDASAAVRLACIFCEVVPINPHSFKQNGENEASVDRSVGNAAAAATLASTLSLLEIDDALLDGDLQLFAIADGHLVTGQTLTSSDLTANTTLQALGVQA